MYTMAGARRGFGELCCALHVSPGPRAQILSAVEERVREAMKGQQFQIIATNLSKEQEENLRATFAEEE
jgi:uncharacterized membrane protein